MLGQKNYWIKKNFGSQKIFGAKKIGLEVGEGWGPNYRIQFIDQYEAYIPNLGQIEILNKHFSEQKFFWRIF